VQSRHLLPRYSFCKSSGSFATLAAIPPRLIKKEGRHLAA
jgi:hypothetical protein